MNGRTCGLADGLAAATNGRPWAPAADGGCALNDVEPPRSLINPTRRAVVFLSSNCSVSRQILLRSRSTV